MHLIKRPWHIALRAFTRFDQSLYKLVAESRWIYLIYFFRLNAHVFRREIHRKYKISKLDFNTRGKESNYGIGIATFESYPFELIVVKDCEFSFHDILEVWHLFTENAVNRRL